MTRLGKNDDERDCGSDDIWGREHLDGSPDDIVSDNAKQHAELPLSESWRQTDRLHSFKNLIGQDGVRDALKARVVDGRVQDHIVIHGEPGVGKRALSALYGQAIVCSNAKASGNPCGSCSACEDFVSAGWNGHWFDLKDLLMDARKVALAKLRRAPTILDHQVIEKKAQQALSDHISDLGERILQGSFANFYSATNAVILVDNADLMGPGVADKLLQALEKAEAPTTGIFVTCDLRKLRPALRSRCQAYRLKPLDRDRATERLLRACERLQLVPEIAILKIIAAHSNYRAGDMLNKLWNVYHDGSVSLQQARTDLDLDWIEQVPLALSILLNGDEEQSRAALSCLAPDPREALNRLLTAMQAVDLVEQVHSRHRDAVLPSAFMYTDDHVLCSLVKIVSECAAQIGMKPSEYRKRLTEAINRISGSRSTSIWADVMCFSRTMRGGQRCS